MKNLKKPLLYTLFWICTATLFGIYTYITRGADLGLQFFSVYLTEYMLSIDNLFVILLIFNYFSVPEKYQYRVLFWGILGAIVFRFLAISLGFEIIQRFHAVLYIFGALLIYTGYKILQEKDEKEHNLDEHKLMVFFKKVLPIAEGDHGKKFFVRIGKKLHITTLFLCLLMIECIDIIFAVDSIPASFAISQVKFIIFTANMFAVLGLRSLFFVVEYVLHKFHLISKALALILFFIGGKMLLTMFHIHISSAISLSVLVTILVSAMALSHVFPKGERRV